MIREFTDSNLSMMRQERNVFEEYVDRKTNLKLIRERQKLELKQYNEDQRERWKEVFKDWRDQFPYLKPLGTMRLMYRTDICLIGLLLEKSQYGGSYDVWFEVKPLWRKFTNNSDYCFRSPVLEVSSRSNSPYYIVYDYNMREDSHHRDFMPAVKSTWEQFGKVLDGRAELDFLMEKLASAYKNEGMLYNDWDCHQYHEFKLALALYFNDKEMWDNACKEIRDNLRGREESLLSWRKPWRRILGKLFGRWSILREKNMRYYKWDLRSQRNWRIWIKTLPGIFGDRDKFMALCEENSKLRKIRTLNKGELIYTPYHEPVKLKKRR